jgi:rhodanese-related sulfurtransferase
LTEPDEGYVLGALGTDAISPVIQGNLAQASRLIRFCGGRSLLSHSSLSSDQLALHIGTQRAPAIVDVRRNEEFDADPYLIPGSIRRDADAVATWGSALAGESVAVVCLDGRALSQGVAAWLRHNSIDAKSLEGGFETWHSGGNLLTRAAMIPPPDASGRTAWVTRERPKIDRIACPWLIQRFVDPEAAFLFVEPAQVAVVAEQFSATPFDIEGVFWSHRGDTCTFDTMLTEFGLKSDALARLATIVRGADTARLDLAPEASGFLALSLGLSRLFDNDLVQLQVGLTFYDAAYLWCRDAHEETHNWPTKTLKR